MDFRFKIKTGVAPESGKLLIAEPLLADPHFERGVVYLCSHNSEGSFGFVLNKPLDKTLDYFIQTLTRSDITVFLGGPVENSSLHFLHTQGELLGGQKTNHGIYFGGDFNKAIALLNDGSLSAQAILFFVGYAGWGPNQLEDEINKKSWLVSNTNQLQLFQASSKTFWEDAILALDKAFHILTRLPKDPSLN